MQETQTPRYLTCREAAKILGIHPDTLRDWSRANKLPTLRLGSRMVRYDEAAVMRMLTLYQPGASKPGPKPNATQ